MSYSWPRFRRPPIQPETCGLKLKVVLKWKDSYVENTCISGVTDGRNVLEWRDYTSTTGIIEYRVVPAF